MSYISFRVWKDVIHTLKGKVCKSVPKGRAVLKFYYVGQEERPKMLAKIAFIALGVEHTPIKSSSSV
jgi:hypothetical protein